MYLLDSLACSQPVLECKVWLLISSKVQNCNRYGFLIMLHTGSRVQNGILECEAATWYGLYLGSKV